MRRNRCNSRITSSTSRESLESRSALPFQTASVHRRGFALGEVVATFLIFGVVLSLAAPLLINVSRQRLAIEQRQFAVQHASNVLERWSSRPWNELTVGPQKLEDASDDLQTLLPNFEQTLEISDVTEKPASRRVTVSVKWRGHSSVAVKPVQMSAWVFQAEEK